MDVLAALNEAIVDGDSPEAAALTREALEAGIDAQTVLTTAMIPAMDTVGLRFQRGEIFIPEMLIAARAMKAGLALLKPFFGLSGDAALGAVVLGTVKGDVHDIGKNLAGMMLEGAGFKVIDLGVDVPADRFVEALRESGAAVLGLSAMLTTTMLNMAEVLRALEEAGLRGRLKVLVGGAPLSEAFAQEIGAEYAGDAAAGAAAAREFVLMELKREG